MNFRVLLVRAATFIGGLYFVLYFLTPQSILDSAGIQSAHEYITTGFILVGAAAIGIGIINISQVHIRRIFRTQSGWSYSVTLILGLVAMLFLAWNDWRYDLETSSKIRTWQIYQQFIEAIHKDSAAQRADVPPVETRLEALRSAVHKSASEMDFHSVEDVQANIVQMSVNLKNAQEKMLLITAHPLMIESLPSLQDEITLFSQLLQEYLIAKKRSLLTAKLFSLLNNGLFVALGSAMFSLLGVYIASAAFRAFRVKSIESSVMMLAAVIVMLGQIPFGLWIYEGLPSWRLWLLSWPNSAAFRAITLGALVAGLVLSIRMWLSIGDRGGDDA